MRRWYLRRAIPWAAVLGSCALSLVAAAVLHRWPTTALGLLPVMVAGCAAAAAFAFDEQAAAVASVTPRGAGWRRTTRLAAAAVPTVVWSGLVLTRPDELPMERAGWWLAGVATVLLALGMAALAARRGVPAPGGLVATLIALLVLCPSVVTGFLGWQSVYPLGDFPGGVALLWAAVAAGGATGLAVALRPGIRA